MLKLRRVGAGVRNVLTPRQKKGAISFFDVKELYDEAYKQKAAAMELTISYELLLKKAKDLDIAYRAQFADQAHKKRVGVAA